jgi:hypothetical protein
MFLQFLLYFVCVAFAHKVENQSHLNRNMPNARYHICSGSRLYRMLRTKPDGDFTADCERLKICATQLADFPTIPVRV